MAKKRKKPATKRRRVSGIDSGTMVVVGALVGGLGAAFLNSKLATQTKPIDPNLIAFGELIAGGATALKFAKGKPFLVGAGIGVAVVGGVKAGSTMGLLSGFRDLQVVNGPGRRKMNGLDYSLGSYQGLIKNAGPQVISGPNVDGSGNCLPN